LTTVAASGSACPRARRGPVRPGLAVLAVLAGCAPERREFEIRAVRERVVQGLRLDADSEERFGLSAGEASAGDAASPSFAYALPEGWTRVPAGAMRDLDLRTAGGVEVWVAKLAGDGGGAAANLDRWRLQFGLAPAAPGAVDALPRQPLLDGSAYRVDLRSGDGAGRLVGLMLFRPAGAVFVRMSGPPELVERELPPFARFVASLQDIVGAATAPHASGRAGLHWTAPPSWFSLTPGPERIAHFRVAAEVEASVTVLGGDGGGLAANVARWCSQVGREPPPGPAELAALPRLEVLGVAAPLVDLTGDGARRGMLALYCPLEGRSVFLKIEGPSDRVRAAREDFVAFCLSLAPRD
jgi:hypothetical protein